MKAPQQGIRLLPHAHLGHEQNRAVRSARELRLHDSLADEVDAGGAVENGIRNDQKRDGSDTPQQETFHRGNRMV